MCASLKALVVVSAEMPIDSVRQWKMTGVVWRRWLGEGSVESPQQRTSHQQGWVVGLCTRGRSDV